MYSRNNLLNKIKKGAYVINLDEYESTGTHWVALFVKPKFRVYFDSFGIEHIPKEINKFIRSKELRPKALGPAVGNNDIKVIYLEYKHMIQLCVGIFV